MTEDQYNEMHDLICDVGKELQHIRGCLEQIIESSNTTAAATLDTYEELKRQRQDQGG